MKLYTVKEVSEILKTSKDFVYKLINNQDLKIVKIKGTTIKITETELNNFIHENEGYLEN